MRTTCILILAFATLSAFSCPVAAPAEDFPQIPLPEKTHIVKADGRRTAGGVEFSLDDFKKTLEMLKGLIAERDALRKVIEEYNRWAKRRSD